MIKKSQLQHYWVFATLGLLGAAAWFPFSVAEAAPPNFINETVVTNLTEPIVMQFLPDGRMLVVGRLGTLWVVQPGATQIDPTPFLQLTNISNNSSENGVFSITLDPNFSQNQVYYLFYTSASPLADRVSRFTANGNTTNLSTEQVIWQDPDVPGVTHHGGSIGFGPDGNLYVSTGEHFVPSNSQLVDSYRGKILRMRSDGTAASDNPFYQGNNQPRDYVWALGLRNPFRISFDQPTGKLYIADVGGNNQATAVEEVNGGVAGANYGWPNCEGPCPSDPNVTGPLFSYPHSGQHASITGGFVYRGNQFPSQYSGAYFYGDFERNWIKGINLNATGQVTGTFNFEPANGASNGPYGNITFMTQGPDGALYYVDYNYDASGNATSPGSIRRIRYIGGNQPPNVVASAAPTAGTPPLTVNFSSAGTSDPENDPLTYSWDFGDSSSSTAPNPSHIYQNRGVYTARLTVSDGTNQVLSTPLNITVGNPPTPSIGSPTTGAFFIARDVINFSGSATDLDDGPLPPSALSWLIIFHHGTHAHPILGPLAGVASGTYTIPNNGHDYTGQTSYEIILTATDSDGLKNSTSVFIFPTKVNVTFDTVPSGLNLFVDGIQTTTPLTFDTLVGFDHTIQAPNQVKTGTSYSFVSWSDGGGQPHTITTPSSNQSYVATYTLGSSGGALSGSVTAPNGPTNLTTDGTLDWAHWGLVSANTFNHKSGVTQQISNITKINATSFNRYQGDLNGYSWTDGTPTSSATNSPNGVWVNGVNRGFQITAPADTTNKNLRLFVSVSNARGKLEVTLSDGSAPTFLDTSLIHTGSGVNNHAVYDIDFRAASAGQTLTVKWTVLTSSAIFGNVTLQAAALKAGAAPPPVNQAPIVNAGSDQTTTLPAGASLSGSVTDDGLPNGTLTTVWSQFSGPGTATFNNANSTATTVTFSADGTYVLRLTGNDSALSASDDLTVIVNSAPVAGLLAGSVSAPSGPTNLTTEGTLDWAHWGLVSANTFNHKSGVAQQISNTTKINGGSTMRYQGDPNGYSWTDGTPTATATNSPNGIWVSGVGRGFQITIPANTTNRTLKLYVSTSNAWGRLEASLSDGSAPNYVDSSLVHSGSGVNNHAVYTINFHSASPGGTLTVKWTILTSSASFGNVTLQAASLH